MYLPTEKPADVPGTGSTAELFSGTLADYASAQICLHASKPAAVPGTGSTAAPPAGTLADHASVQICLLANLLLFLGLVLPLRPLLVP